MGSETGDTSRRRGSRSPTLIGSVQRALRVLEEVAGSTEPLPAKAIARRLDIALPTTYHLLRTLAHEGYIDRLGDGRWSLGGRADLLQNGQGPTGALGRCRPVLHEAAAGMASTLYVARWHDGEVEMVDIVDVPGCPRIELWVGIHDAVHATALGKAILSGLGSRDRHEFVHSHQLPDFTRCTMTDRARLLREVEAQPTPVDREEYAPGVACIAAPLRLGDTPAAIAITLSPTELDSTLVLTAERLRSYACRVELASAVV